LRHESVTMPKNEKGLTAVNPLMSWRARQDSNARPLVRRRKMGSCC